jgi:hypothetical protein
MVKERSLMEHWEIELEEELEARAFRRNVDRIQDAQDSFEEDELYYQRVAPEREPVRAEAQ